MRAHLAVNEIDVPAEVDAQFLVVHEVFTVYFVNDAGFRGGFWLRVVLIVVVIIVVVAGAVLLLSERVRKRVRRRRMR